MERGNEEAGEGLEDQTGERWLMPRFVETAENEECFKKTLMVDADN